MYQENVVQKNMLTLFIKDFNIFMYDHTLHCGKNCFCYYCLQAFSTNEILKHIKYCFKINGKKKIRMPKKGKYVKFKNYKRKMKSPFIIYADIESTGCPKKNFICF